MKTTLSAVAILAMASQAEARCNDIFSAYGPGTDESVELAACFISSAKLNPAEFQNDPLNSFNQCVEEITDKTVEELTAMSDADYDAFVGGNFHMWTFEHEMDCHVGKLQENPAYDPKSALQP